MMIDTSIQEALQARLIAYGWERGYEKRALDVPFSVTFHLVREVAGYGQHHLDALIQTSVVIDALEGAKLPPSSRPYTIPMPLDIVWTSEDGIPLYNATSLFPVGEHKKGVFYWVKRNDEMISRIAERKKDGTPWQPDSGSGTNKEYRMPLPTLHTKALQGYAVGDMEEVRRLLSLLGLIGKKQGWGFGHILRVEIAPVDLPHPLSFLRDEELLRPVPVSALSALGYQAKEGIAQYIAYSPPYWLPMHQTQCYAEGTQIDPLTATAFQERYIEVQSVAEFLWYCQKVEYMRHPVGALTLNHPKLQKVPDGQLCAVTGTSIGDDMAVARKDGISDNMGNVGDFLKASDSHWICNACAVILSQPKTMHRNLVALIGPDKQGFLISPTLAVDPDHPRQERPLWREIVLALTEQYYGHQCVLIFKDEPKSRLWPRARMGVVGNQTPLYFSDGELSIQDLLLIDIRELARQMLLIESWLDLGYTRTAIRTGAFTADIERLTETLAIQAQLEEMQRTAEFLPAWRIARNKADRDLRKGLSHAE